LKKLEFKQHQESYQAHNKFQKKTVKEEKHSKNGNTYSETDWKLVAQKDAFCSNQKISLNLHSNEKDDETVSEN
jgi:NACalpha-BTF3-like transcription factor